MPFGSFALGHALGARPSFQLSRSEFPASGSNIGMYFWNSTGTSGGAAAIIGNGTAENTLIAQLTAIGVTDLFVYTGQSRWAANTAAIAAFVGKCTAANIRCWGLDGYRAWFTDSKDIFGSSGPQGLYDSINALIAYNAAAPASQKFYGFIADMEPQDQTDDFVHTTFHNNIANSALSTTAGSGVWSGRSQYQDRYDLLADMVAIHATAKSLCHAAGLKFGAALNTFFDNYQGEPLITSYGGRQDDFFKLFAPQCDLIALMSYNTSVANVLDRISQEYAWAPSLGRPRAAIAYGCETNAGAGNNVSYADTAGKNDQATVLADMASIKTSVAANPRHWGYVIHAVSGWQALQATQPNAADTLIARMTTTPDATRQSLIRALVNGLMADGVWSRLTAFYMLACHDQADSLLDWLNAHDLTVVGTTSTFAVDKGWTFTHTTGNGLKSAVNPATLSVNDISIGGWASGTVTGGGTIIGNTKLRLVTSGTDASLQTRANDTGSDTQIVGTGDPRNEFSCLSRDAADHYFKQVGTTEVQVNVASTGATSGATGIGELGDSQTIAIGQTVNFAFIGASLTKTQRDALRSRVHTFLSAIGAVA